MNIPINNVLSRDESFPHNHEQALFIYNLEPNYMSGSHWVATYVKNGIINYFDSFGMPPFQEIVNHAKGSEQYVKAKNGRLMLKCKCSECGITKTRFVKQQGNGIAPSKGAGISDTVASTGADLLIQHGIPWLGKKKLLRWVDIMDQRL